MNIHEEIQKYQARVPGLFSADDTEAAYHICSLLPQEGTFVEIGSLIGKSSVTWARHFRDLNKKYDITCIDSFNWPTWQIKNRIGSFDETYQALVKLLRENAVEESIIDSVIFSDLKDPSQLDLFRLYTKPYDNISAIHAEVDINFTFPQQVDCVFEDSCHNKEVLDVMIPYWWDRVKSGGILCGHDYYKAGNPRATKERLQFTQYVSSCVNEFARFKNVEVNTFNTTSSIWYLHKG